MRIIELFQFSIFLLFTYTILKVKSIKFYLFIFSLLRPVVIIIIFLVIKINLNDPNI